MNTVNFETAKHKLGKYKTKLNVLNQSKSGDISKKNLYNERIRQYENIIHGGDGFFSTTSDEYRGGGPSEDKVEEVKEEEGDKVEAAAEKEKEEDKEGNKVEGAVEEKEEVKKNIDVVKKLDNALDNFQKTSNKQFDELDNAINDAINNYNIAVNKHKTSENEKGNTLQQLQQLQQNCENKIKEQKQTIENHENAIKEMKELHEKETTEHTEAVTTMQKNMIDKLSEFTTKIKDMKKNDETA
jgi:hypothetical protein